MNKNILTLCIVAICFFALTTTVFAGEMIESAISDLHSNSIQTRKSAVQFLVKHNTQRSTEGLISAIHSHDANIRYLAVIELANRAAYGGDERAVEGLISAIHSNDSRVRVEAVQALADTPSQRSTEGLINALHSADYNLPMTAVKALAQRANNGLQSQRAIEGLIMALDNPNEEIRLIAVRALADNPSQRANEGLKKALHDYSPAVQNIARNAVRNY